LFLWPHLTAAENVALALKVVDHRSPGEAAVIAKQWLKALGLGHRVDAKPGTLSGGDALALLRERGVLADYPPLSRTVLARRARVSDLTLRHELEIMDVKAAFHSAVRKTTTSFTIATFNTWPILYQFQALRAGSGAETPMKPDGFIRIHERTADGHLDEHSFFLELDRSSEAQDRLTRKAVSYLDYYQSGGFAADGGASRSEYKNYPFRVLMVFKTAERRNNTAEHLLQNDPPIFTQACLSTFEEVTTDPLGVIWTCPRDYREATAGTRFDVEHKPNSCGYRRQFERDRLVGSRIKKFALLAPLSP
jgi:Replication-relaxation